MHLPLRARGRRVQVVQEGEADVRRPLGLGHRWLLLTTVGANWAAFEATISPVLSMYSSTVCMPRSCITLRVTSRSQDPSPRWAPPVLMAGS
ncbi:hypothetical protein ACFS5L_43895 [Streptomyces phyllanthi]|uniref:Uncharacterized protein n=1 Tax=Streptomyces phyllanthi TaxID=1803180 RepID=A0A5N8W807_9ACTN|nr:hypothetical protein [Streptomyces phyllanthi]MPY42444.1 hypothetical protein [Streptomyces phyllanthi]